MITAVVEVKSVTVNKYNPGVSLTEIIFPWIFTFVSRSFLFISEILVMSKEVVSAITSKENMPIIEAITESFNKVVSFIDRFIINSNFY